MGVIQKLSDKDRQLIDQDLVLFGNAIVVDGRRVDPAKVVILRSNPSPPFAYRASKLPKRNESL